MQTLDLSYNSFEGPIPATIGDLPNIQFISLTANNLTKLPDSIGRLKTLVDLAIDLNQISGTFPSTFWNLTSLTSFLGTDNNFYGNLSNSIINQERNSILFFTITQNLLTGPLPDQLYQWKFLRTIELNFNSFTGTVPNTYGDFSYLLVIAMNANFLTGTNIYRLFDTSGENLRLQSLQISNNLFSGSSPTGSWQLIKFYLTFANYFTGTIPYIFVNTSSIYYLDVSNNYLTGRLPTYLPSLDRLTYFNVSLNMFTGPFTYNLSMTNTNRLQQLAMSYNFLTGTLTPEIAYLRQLIYLIMNNNQFLGTLPKRWILLEKLEICFLQNNQITGPLYPYLLPSLLNLDVSNNLFTGQFPSFNTENLHIETFAGSSNCFTGSIPLSICNATTLTFLSLDGLSTAEACRSYIFPKSSFLNGFYVKDYLSDGIPECLFRLPNLKTLHISGNGLTGSFPSDLNISESLVDLSLSHNQLTGTIPLVVQKRNWQNLDLSYNKFSGTLSDDFHSYDAEGTSLSLQINRLSGSIPTSLLTARDINILQGNMFSCNLNHDDLPSHDDKYEDYSCGSDVVNATLYSWLSLIVVAISLLYLTNYKLVNKRILALLKLSTKSSAGSPPGNSLVSSSQSESYSKEEKSLGTSPTDSLTPPEYFQVDVSALTFLRKIIDYREFLLAINRNDKLQVSHLSSFYYFMWSLRRLVGFLVLVIFFFLMPIYVGTSYHFSAYYYEYAWVVSGVLLTGKNAAIILFVVLMVFLWLLIYCLKEFNQMNLFHLYQLKERRTQSISPVNRGGPSKDVPAIELTGHISTISREEIDSSLTYQGEETLKETIINNDCKSSVTFQIEDVGGIHKLTEIAANRSNANSHRTHPSLPFFKETESEKVVLERRRRKRLMILCIYTTIAVVDCIVMILADIAYVLVLLTYPTGMIILMEVFLAMLKILLNNQGIWMAIPFLRRQLLPYFLPEKYHTDRSSQISENSYDLYFQFSSTHYDFSSSDVSFISFIILLNNVIFPVVAILIVSPECFFNALFAADAVVSKYSYTICDRATIVSGVCNRNVVLSEQSSYDPAYIPDFECASTIMINYVPVFIIMLTFESLVLPGLKLFLQWWYFKVKYFEILKLQKSPLDKDQNHHPDAIERGSVEGDQKAKERELVFDTRPNRQLREGNRLLAILHAVLPENLRELVPNPPQENQKDKTTIVLFNKNRLAVRLNTYLLILASFGSLFPPLAVIVYVTIYTVTVFEEIVIGRLLYESERLGYAWYKKQLERDCYGIADSLKYTLWSIVPVSSFYFAYLVLDMWADGGDVQSAVILGFMLFLIPILTLFLISLKSQDDSFQRMPSRSPSVFLFSRSSSSTWLPPFRTNSAGVTEQQVQNPINM